MFCFHLLIYTVFCWIFHESFACIQSQHFDIRPNKTVIHGLIRYLVVSRQQWIISSSITCSSWLQWCFIWGLGGDQVVRKDVFTSLRPKMLMEFPIESMWSFISNRIRPRHENHTAMVSTYTYLITLPPSLPPLSPSPSLSLFSSSILCLPLFCLIRSILKVISGKFY